MTVTAILPLPAWLAECPEAVFAPVAGMSPLLRIVDSLGRNAEVVVAAAASLTPGVREALGAHNVSVRVLVVDPPGGRAQCVAAALDGLDGDAPVLLHDIEWPIVGPALVADVLSALADAGAAVLPLRPVTDSVKAVDAARMVTATVDRSQLRTVQYPRGFTAATLASLVAGEGEGRFDDLELALSKQCPITLVDGDPEAISVRLPRDSDYLSAVLQVRQNLGEC